MIKYLYLSLLPEALVFSMLPPREFGKYMAIGDKKLSHSAAMFFQVDPEIELEDLPLKTARDRCVPHKNGSPRRSAYVAIHNVLARIPIPALGELHLATRDGLVLSLSRVDYSEPPEKRWFLYQEICPVYPRVVSSLSPKTFSDYVTAPCNPLYLPKLMFADMRLGDLAVDPDHAEARNLPYPEMGHLRACLKRLEEDDSKKTKIVRRDIVTDAIYYLLDTGFYVGDQEYFVHYPMPDEESLYQTHHQWWNSAVKAERY